MSPRAMGSVAAALLVLRALARALGLDAWVSVISGTPPPAGVSVATAAAVGAAVVLLHLATVLLAPVLVIAAVVLRAMVRSVRASRPASASGPTT